MCRLSAKGLVNFGFHDLFSLRVERNVRVMAHTCGMSEDKKFCPNCKAMTMEPVEEPLLAPEELNQVEPALACSKGDWCLISALFACILHMSLSSEAASCTVPTVDCGHALACFAS